jgi:predicted GTPase
MGYHPSQLEALRDTINRADADVVVVATPCDLDALIAINKPVVRVRYELAEISDPGLGGLVEAFLRQRRLLPR